MSSAAYLKAWRDNQRAKGLCIDCTEPVAPGHSRCAKHFKTDSDRQQPKKFKRLEQGNCWSCGRPVEDSQFANCVVCRAPHHFNPFRGG